MKKGFTLMEVLAVLLILALVTTFVAPAFRAVRYEIRNSQARVATKKLAEALQTYYQESRGGKIDACFKIKKNCTVTNNIHSILSFEPDETKCDATELACVNPAATGIPANTRPDALTSAEQLFACGYLSAKDFAKLPYTFCTSKRAADTAFSGSGDFIEGRAIAFANDALAGEKYFKSSSELKGHIYVNKDMEIEDTYDGDDK